MTQAEIEAFLAVCHHRSISHAAQALFLSQPSLSTRIKTLEREVGCSLLRRQPGHREIQLTPAGERFLRLATRQQELWRQMLAVGADSQEQAILRIAAFNSIGSYLLPAAYDRFLKQAPAVQLQVQEWIGSSRPALHDAEAPDLIFTNASETGAALTFLSTPFLSESMVFLCAAGADYPELVSVAELSVGDEVYIDWDDRFAQWHRTVFHNAMPPITLQTMEQLRFFLSQGKNWALVPASVAAGALTDPRIRTRSVSFSLPPRIIAFQCLPQTLERPWVQQFLTCLYATLQDRAGEGLTLLV